VLAASAKYPSYHASSLDDHSVGEPFSLRVPVQSPVYAACTESHGLPPAVAELREEEQGCEGLEDESRAAAPPPAIRAWIPERFCSAEISSEGALPNSADTPCAPPPCQSKLWETTKSSTDQRALHALSPWPLGRPSEQG
jgi:hypothetical protein